MLKSRLLHPEILYALACAGHGSKVLLADSNYPISTQCGPHATIVHLNVSPGVVPVSHVLELICEAVPIESAQVMRTEDGQEAEAVAEYRKLLGPDVPISAIRRSEFYAAVHGEDCALIIATGEQRLFACILLTVGVVSS
jgi:L-fucose mutarotase